MTERKSFPFELEEKGVDEEQRTIKGYAAITGNIDEGEDVIDRGAFRKTLSESGDRVKAYYIHDFHEPIGKPSELAEVPRSKLPKTLRDKYPDATGGLYTHFKISETRRGNDALVLARDGVLDEMSIGYKTIKEDMEDIEGRSVRHIKELKLIDVSLVPMAMNPAAVVTDVKSVDVDELPLWDQEKPYPNEHSCQLKDPDQYDTCRRGDRVAKEPASVSGKKYHVIYCKKGDGPMEQQAFRYPTETWSADQARAHCEFNKGSFHAASGKPKGDLDLIEGKFAGSPRSRYGTHGSYGFKGNYAAAWRCHFSKVGGGGTSGAASGPIRGTVRRTEMIAAAMKPACKLPETDSIGPRSGPKSPLDCTFPSSPKDYGLSNWDKPERDEERAKTQLSCSDLAVIKRAALAEIKRRAKDREDGKGFEPEDVDEIIDGDPLAEDLEALVGSDSDWSGAEGVEEAELSALRQRAQIQRQMIEAHLKE